MVRHHIGYLRPRMGHLERHARRRTTKTRAGTEAGLGIAPAICWGLVRLEDDPMDETQAIKFWQGVILGIVAMVIVVIPATDVPTKISFGVFLLLVVWSLRSHFRSHQHK